MLKYPVQTPFVAGTVLTSEAALFLNGLVDGMAQRPTVAGVTPTHINLTIDGVTYQIPHDGTV